MTRRHERLIPLTHDHHHALAQARRLIAAADAWPEERKKVATGFEEFFQKDSLVHFREEEEVLFPLLLQNMEAAPQELVTALIDHVYIHGLVARLAASVDEGAADGALMKHLGETLRAHVRFEETELFPLIERAVPEGELSEVAFAERARG